MSARKVWVVQCEICDTTIEFGPGLSVEQLGDEIRDARWSMPVYGGTFCPRCTSAVEALKKVRSP